MRKSCAGHLAIRNFTSVFDDRTSFRAKGLGGTSWNRNFTSVFGDRTSFRAKGLRGTTWTRTFTSVFGDRTSFRVKGLCAGHLAIRNFTSFLAIEPRFVRKGCVSCRLVGTAPAPAFRREIENKERGRGQDEKMWRWADVKMWRCEDEQMWRWEGVKMRRCEDEKMWKWEDVKMRSCEDEKLWRWEDVKMRRCENAKMRYKPPLLEEPSAQTLSGKKDIKTSLT